MAVSPLSRVTLTTSVGGLDRLLTELLRFGRFHPSHREGLVQDIHLLLVLSRAQACYGRASELYRHPAFDGTAAEDRPRAEFHAEGVDELLGQFEQSLDTIDRTADLLHAREDRQSFADTLQAIRDASLALFHALERILVVAGAAGELTLEGYVPGREVDRLKRLVGDTLRSAVPVGTRGPDDPYIPTLLVNPRVVALFEDFTVQRGIPKYNEIDPTPLVALVFPLFFGLMFGDVGHGLVLLGVGSYLVLRTRYVYWGKLLVVFSVSATAVGFLRGAFFGVPFSTPFHAVLSLPAVVSASSTFVYIPLLLEAALLIGTFHLASAYVIAFLNQVKSERYGEALLGALPTLVLYASLVPLGLAVVGAGLAPTTVFSDTSSTPFFAEFLGVDIPVNLVARIASPLVLGSYVVLVAGPSILAYRTARFKRARKALRALREGLLRGLSRPSEFFLNTVSYIRLAALLITNTLLAVLIAGTLRYGPIGIAVAAFLNLLVMAMEGLIVYLQDMRLHWFEWLPKFYAGTGTAFRPVELRGPRFEVRWASGAGTTEMPLA